MTLHKVLLNYGDRKCLLVNFTVLLFPHWEIALEKPKYPKVKTLCIKLEQNLKIAKSLSILDSHVRGNKKLLTKGNKRGTELVRKRH